MDEEEFKKRKRLSLIFGIIEMTLIVMVGLILQIKIEVIAITILIFEVIRKFVRKPMHYRDYRDCAIWSIALFFTIFLVSKVNIYLGYAMAGFASIIVSEKGDIKRRFLGDIGYKKLVCYIHNYSNNKDVKEFEEKLRKCDEGIYEIYKSKIIEGKTQREIAQITNLDERRIAEKMNAIKLTMKVYFSDMIDDP